MPRDFKATGLLQRCALRNDEPKNHTVQRKLIHEKLPPDYSLAFSLHLINEQCGLKQTKVSRVEWIGAKIDISEIKRAFPKESIVYQSGRAYLIYKNGTVKLI